MSTPKRVVWLYTQPERYFNLMMDDLAAVGAAGPDPLEHTAVFMSRGPGWYKDIPVPRVAKHQFLRYRPGMEGRPSAGWQRIHLDWRADMAPLQADALVINGYAGRTQREMIRDFHRRGIPVLMSADSNLRSERHPGLKGRLRRVLKRRFLQSIVSQVDYFLPTNRLGTAYWRYYGAPPRRIVLFPCYADYASIEQARGSDPAAALAAVGLPATAKVILTSARLAPVKNLGLMIRAFRESGLARDGWVYAIAGTGPLEGELKAEAGEDLGGSIRLLGFVQQPQLLPLLCHAKLMVLPSLYEPHGIVIAEACAAGTPVLASDICGAAYDLVLPGLSGWTFRSNDLADLLSKLRLATGQPEQLAALRPSTRWVFERWFAQTNPVQVADRLLRQVLAGQRAQDQALRGYRPPKAGGVAV